MHVPSAGTDTLSRADRHDAASRLAVFDTLKAVASQLIVLHHLVAYGPLAEAFRSRFPQLADWLYYDGRLAVQVFFVIGGFLAARALAPALQPRPLSLPAVLWKRYRRLALPCMTSELLILLCENGGKEREVDRVALFSRLQGE